jgi:hypothetical protein
LLKKKACGIRLRWFPSARVRVRKLKDLLKMPKSRAAGFFYKIVTCHCLGCPD